MVHGAMIHGQIPMRVWGRGVWTLQRLAGVPHTLTQEAICYCILHLGYYSLAGLAIVAIAYFFRLALIGNIFRMATRFRKFL